jgi:hypothetical protein
MLWAVLRAFGVQRSLRRAGSPSFIGGLRYGQTGGRISESFNATWPFARLDVGSDRVTIALDRDMWRLARFARSQVPASTTFVPKDACQVDAGSGGLRFWTVDTSDERDGLCFWFLRRDREEVLRLVAAAGFPLSPS